MDTPDSAHTHCEREAAKSWRTLEPFHALSDTAWAQVSAKLQTQTVTEGEVILRAGDTALQAFILLRGYAEVAVGDTERVVSKVTEGVLFGELDLLMVCPVFFRASISDNCSPIPDSPDIRSTAGTSSIAIKKKSIAIKKNAAAKPNSCSLPAVITDYAVTAD